MAHSLSSHNSSQALDIHQIRADFPILEQQINGHRLAYLDNGATTQKPQQVIDAIAHYYRHINSNVHRGVHTLSHRATEAYETARDTVQKFIGAASRKEIIFTKGTTESINLVAQSYGRSQLIEGDEIIISTMEHHSNIVPWQLLCEQTGAQLKVIPVDDNGELEWEKFTNLLNTRTKIVALVHLSNSLGTINPVSRIIEAAHAAGAVVLLDGAQATPHLSLDVQSLDVDFYALSSHKAYGPTGTGILYAKQALLEAMPPYQGGGDMIRQVSFEKTTYNDLPHKFEAGTPDIAGAIGMAAAFDYLSALGLDAIAAHETDLLEYAMQRLPEVDGVRVVGTASEKSGILSFVMNSAHAHDIGTVMDSCGVAVRTGHHCTMPLMKRYGLAATARASFGLYNTRAEVDQLIEAMHKVNKVFT